MYTVEQDCHWGFFFLHPKHPPPHVQQLRMDISQLVSTASDSAVSFFFFFFFLTISMLRKQISKHRQTNVVTPVQVNWTKVWYWMLTHHRHSVCCITLLRMFRYLFFMKYNPMLCLNYHDRWSLPTTKKKHFGHNYVYMYIVCTKTAIYFFLKSTVYFRFSFSVCRLKRPCL